MFTTKTQSTDHKETETKSHSFFRYQTAVEWNSKWESTSSKNTHHILLKLKIGIQSSEYI